MPADLHYSNKKGGYDMKKVLKKNIKQYENANLYVTAETTTNDGCTDTSVKLETMCDDKGTHACAS